MTEPESTIEKKAPTCYRHPDRETWVTCGRCGKPLCPDCMMHGPVGVRCRECLLPQGKTGAAGMLDAGKVKKAVGVAIGLAAAWIIIIFPLSLLTGGLGPNLLLSGAAGGTVGWTIWRICQRTWNGTTVKVAVVLGIVVPLAATLLIAGVHLLMGAGGALAGWQFSIRQLAAVGVSTLMAWLLATNNR